MKILYIADSTSIHTKRWIQYFLEAGHEIYIITIGKKTEYIKGVIHLANFERFYYRSPMFLKVIRRTRRIVRQISPHVLHGHFVHQYGWLAALAGYHPLVLTAWGSDILHLPGASRSRFGRWFTTYAMRQADLLTATSRHLKNEMVKLGAPNDRVQVVYWGVDTRQFHPDVDTRPLKKKLGIADASHIVLSNRNQILLYNNDIVVKAMVGVLKSFPGAVLILQNSGGNLEKDLRRLVEKENISGSVHFLPNFPHHELPPLYALADIYVSIPSWDAGPVSLKEAMSCGGVPVVSALPGPMEWIRDGVNGRVVPVRDSEKLTEAICDLLRNPQECEKYRKINRDLIVKKANHSAMMKKMNGWYHKIGRAPSSQTIPTAGK